MASACSAVGVLVVVSVMRSILVQVIGMNDEQHENIASGSGRFPVRPAPTRRCRAALVFLTPSDGLLLPYRLSRSSVFDDPVNRISTLPMSPYAISDEAVRPAECGPLELQVATTDRMPDFVTTTRS